MCTWSSPRGLNTAQVTVSVWPWNTETEWWLASRKSHNLKVESLEAVTTRRAEGWEDVWVNSSSCPVSWWSSWPVWVSHKLAIRSQPAVTAWSPPGNQSAAMTTPLWPERARKGVRSTENSSLSSVSVPKKKGEIFGKLFFFSFFLSSMQNAIRPKRSGSWDG